MNVIIKHIILIPLACLMFIGCQKSIKEKNRKRKETPNYKLDFSEKNILNYNDFIDSIQIHKVRGKEPIMLRMYAGHILKSSGNDLFFKPNEENIIYCIDNQTYTIKWEISMKSAAPNFPDILFDFALDRDKKEIYLWDYYKKLFYVYSFDGVFSRNIQPNNLPSKSYFSHYNFVKSGKIIFHLQGMPDPSERYSEDYTNRLFSYYDVDQNQFSPLHAIPEGSPYRNSNTSRNFHTVKNDRLLYSY